MALLREYYENAYHEVLAKGVVWECLYDCPGAARFRKFAMRVLPMHASSGILVVNSLRSSGLMLFPDTLL
jgi:hypothetical protein